MKTPWDAFGNRTADLLDPECLPPGQHLKTPRKISKEDVVMFFEHITKRQETFVSLYKVFHFDNIPGPDKTLVPADYPLEVSGKRASCDGNVPATRRGKNKRGVSAHSFRVRPIHFL